MVGEGVEGGEENNSRAVEVSLFLRDLVLWVRSTREVADKQAQKKRLAHPKQEEFKLSSMAAFLEEYTYVPDNNFLQETEHAEKSIIEAKDSEDSF